MSEINVAGSALSPGFRDGSSMVICSSAPDVHTDQPTFRSTPSTLLDYLGLHRWSLWRSFHQTVLDRTKTGLNRNATQPDLARPNWTVENRRLAVIADQLPEVNQGVRDARPGLRNPAGPLRAPPTWLMPVR